MANAVVIADAAIECEWSCKHFEDLYLDHFAEAGAREQLYWAFDWILYLVNRFKTGKSKLGSVEVDSVCSEARY